MAWCRVRLDEGDDIRDGEELASALTHGVGAVASVTGGAVLITVAALGGDGWQLLSAIIFSATSGN